VLQGKAKISFLVEKKGPEICTSVDKCCVKTCNERQIWIAFDECVKDYFFAN
jgi:hypothetical protein